MTAEQMTGVSSIVVAVTGLVTALGVIYVAVVQKRQGTAVKEVKAELKAVIPVVQDTATQLGVVHKIVNSGYLEDLRIGMVAAKTLAAFSPTLENTTLAEAATKKYNEHLLSQRQLEAAPPVVVRPTNSEAPVGTLQHAIDNVTELAQDTVESAEKTVEHAEKVPRKP